MVLKSSRFFPSRLVFDYMSLLRRVFVMRLLHHENAHRCAERRDRAEQADCAVAK
jgi:hypothetical protein